MGNSQIWCRIDIDNVHTKNTVYHDRHHIQEMFQDHEVVPAIHTEDHRHLVKITATLTTTPLRTIAKLDTSLKHHHPLPCSIAFTTLDLMLLLLYHSICIGTITPVTGGLTSLVL